MISPQRRDEVVDALRRGTVPRAGLGELAVGLDRFEATIDEELGRVRRGGSLFKAIRGEYGSGKTFFVRWLAERAKGAGFVTSEVQISEGETPLHRLETVYRRIAERLSTSEEESGAFRSVVDRWFYGLEEAAIDAGEAAESDEAALSAATEVRLERRLGEVSSVAPAFASALRGYRRAMQAGDLAQAEALLAWAGGQPNVAAAAKRYAGIRGDLDHFGALAFLRGLTDLAREAGHAGMVVVLDEVETLQRVRSDVRERALNALRQLIDELDAGRFPGLAVVITGTQAFFEGPQGIRRLPPLAQRLHVDFGPDARFDNPRAPQVRLASFDVDALTQVGRRVREVYAAGAADADRVRGVVDDALIADLARGVAGELGGQVGVAPRLFLRKLVADVLDRVELFEDFVPRRDYELIVSESELSEVERGARAVADPDSVDLSG
ncbi:MAG: BREX system ATP-binding protein BrxD [Actinomycetota bacterium]|nr:BREX system ATP-binding protein BrxD [Actinomycetota bacterium]